MSGETRPADQTISPIARYDIDWGPVAGSVVWTPQAYRQETLDESTVLRILRCTPASLTALCDLGLTPARTPDGPRYDACDIRNAGLYSRSGKTEVEAAMQPILSFLKGADADLFAERRWSYQMLPVADSAEREPERYLIHPLAPEVAGGHTDKLEAGSGPAGRVGDRVVVPPGAALSGLIVSRGQPATVADKRLRSITEKFLASGVRWHYLADELKQDAHAAFAAGVGNCDTLSTVLATWLADAGYAPSIYRGWIVGITAVAHSWIEVPDLDGKQKVIDPSLLLLAAHSSLGTPAFAEQTFGARLSRVVPTRCPLSEPLAISVTGARALPCDVRFTCRPANRGSSARASLASERS